MAMVMSLKKVDIEHLHVGVAVLLDYIAKTIIGTTVESSVFQKFPICVSDLMMPLYF